MSISKSERFGVDKSKELNIMVRGKFSPKVWVNFIPLWLNY